MPTFLLEHAAKISVLIGHDPAPVTATSVTDNLSLSLSELLAI
jgi:hypothetical protein